MSSIKKEVAELKDIVLRTNGEMIWKANKYEETKSLLKNVKIEVDKIHTVLNDATGKLFLKVEYKVSPINIYIDEDGEVIASERFRAMNMLNLVSIDDMMRIQKEIVGVKKKNGD